MKETEVWLSTLTLLPKGAGGPKIRVAKFMAVIPKPLTLASWDFVTSYYCSLVTL